MSSTPIVSKGGLSFEYLDFYIPWENASICRSRPSQKRK